MNIKNLDDITGVVLVVAWLLLGVGVVFMLTGTSKLIVELTAVTADDDDGRQSSNRNITSFYDILRKSRRVASEIRERNGKSPLPVLTRSPDLEHAAQARLADMQQHRYWAHRHPDHNALDHHDFVQRFYTKHWAECLSRTNDPSLEFAYIALLSSEKHRELLIDHPLWYEVGVAAGQVHAAGWSQPMWVCVVLFGEIRTKAHEKCCGGVLKSENAVRSSKPKTGRK